MVPLVVHCRYRSSLPSGENMAVEREVDLLAAGGPLLQWIRSTDDLVAGGLLGRVRGLAELGGPPGHGARLRRELARLRPSVVHAHNLWPFYGGELHRTAHALGIPTVQSLHNFRLIAGNGRFLGPHPRPARSVADQAKLVGMDGLYPGRLQEALYAWAIQRAWDRGLAGHVAAWLCLSRFQRQAMIEAGLPPERLVIKQNALADDLEPGNGEGGYAIFVGRLGAEKGLLALADAWRESGLPTLVVVGDGPLAAALAQRPEVRLTGRLPSAETRRLIGGARFLVMNSTAYEGQPLVLIEALAAGTPALVPAAGSMAEMVGGGRWGLTFPPQDAVALVAAARRLWAEAPALRSACRARYLDTYTPTQVLTRQRRIYGNVIAGRLPGADLELVP